MSKAYNYARNSFEVFLEDRVVLDPDEMLGRALKYLKNKGQNVFLLGFDNKKTPMVKIDDNIYIFDQTFGLWQGAKFTKTNTDVVSEEPISRKNKIEKYYKQ